MKAIQVLILLLLFPLPASALDPAESKKEFTSLFDGKTFEGWKHSGNWVIEDGAFYRKKKGGLTHLYRGNRARRLRITL